MVWILFRYLEPFRRGSRMWQTDRRTDFVVANAALYYTLCGQNREWTPNEHESKSYNPVEQIIRPVASPGFVARRGKGGNYAMGHSRWTSGPGAAAARWLIVLWLMQYWSKEMRVVHICISWSRGLHNTWIVGSQIYSEWTRNKIVVSRGGGHVPQCPKAGDATDCHSYCGT